MNAYKLEFHELLFLEFELHPRIDFAFRVCRFLIFEFRAGEVSVVFEILSPGIGVSTATKYTVKSPLQLSAAAAAALLGVGETCLASGVRARALGGAPLARRDGERGGAAGNGNHRLSVLLDPDRPPALGAAARQTPPHLMGFPPLDLPVGGLPIQRSNNC